ncbi:MAG: molybdopterin cofactor-binding domain-containing protein [Verrucomicrobiota bacterium]
MRHCDSELHVTGRSEYIDDVRPPAGMLHAVVFGSPVAHGAVVKLAVEEAREVPGVRGVFSVEDIPGTPQLGPVRQDEWLFARDEVRYLGQPLAVVVADSLEAARAGRARCRVEIEERPVVTCPREAFRQGLVLQEPQVFEMGNVNAAWDRCAHLVEGSVDLGGQEHLYLETHRARALPREDGQMMVWSSTQSPSAVQKTIAAILDEPMHKIEVDVKRLGGGFGGKEDQATHFACMVALAARLLDAPVQIVLSRAEDTALTGKRHPYKQDFKLGLDADGRILAVEFHHYQNSGAYMDLSGPVLERTVLHSTNAYAVPNVRIQAAACRTNLPPNTAFRGFGGPQGMFVMECALAKAAEATGIPRETLQARNLIEDGYVFHYGQRLTASRMRRTWEEAEDRFDFAGARARIEQFNTHSRFRKKGAAIMPVCFGISFTKTFLNQASSLVHIYTDGSVSIATGGIEMGQGVSTNMIALAARTFGIPPGRIRVNSTNTTRIANISPSAASATSDLNGNATLVACRSLLAGLKLTIVEMLGMEPSEAPRASFIDGRACIDGVATDLSWEQVVVQAYLARRELMAHGFYASPQLPFDVPSGKGSPFHYYTFGTCRIEVTVDALRGTYKIDQIQLVHDLGRGIVPAVDLGQVEGGLAQGIGWVTLEEHAWDERGRTTSHALSTYKAPDAEFLPDQFDIHFLENADNPGGPLGSKAVGEPPFMYGIAAYFALRDAIGAYRGGAPPGEFRSPLTPEQVLLSLARRDRPEPPREIRSRLERPSGMTPAPSASARGALLERK